MVMVYLENRYIRRDEVIWELCPFHRDKRG